LQRAPRCSIAKYLEEFQKNERKRSNLLTYDNIQLRRDWEAKNSIVVTWQISFEHIQQTRPSAADLLSLMSFFDRQGIPESVLRSGREHGETQRIQRVDNDWHSDEEDEASQCSAGDDAFEHDVVTLRNFCFISVDTNGTSFEMHALVQLATRMWLAANAKIKMWRQRFISTLCAEFPTGKYENWAACQALFSHARSAAGQQPEDESSLVEWASLLHRAAWYAEMMGNITDAVMLAVKSMEVRKKVLGLEHEDTLWSISMVGSAYELEGRWTDAEPLFVQVMETRKTKLGADHPFTLISMASLAKIYWDQGRWDDAEALGVQVMETRKTKLGADHPDTLTSMTNLAATYWNQGRWDDAEALFVQVMETSKIKVGADHPDTLTRMANLAATYMSQGQWDDAEALFAQVIEKSKIKLGADHPDTLTRMSNLAATYWDQGRWDDAETLEVQVMETRKMKLGANHPGTLSSMANLAFTLKGQGYIRKAISLLEDCYKLQAVVRGPQHPYTISCREALATWRLEVAELERADKKQTGVIS
jgi:tetratricopeptide (TPR) repeat protein